MKIAAAVLLVLLPGAGSAAAQTPPPIPVTRTSEPIRLDGDLSDPGWKGAAIVDSFWETSPGDNVAPRVKTTAFLTYDEKYFYVGLDCEDPEPAKIRAPYVDRDQIIGTDDNVAVFIDTRNDRRSALELRVNPRGSQGDAVWNDANFTEDFSPDFFYDTAAQVTTRGWTAEMRIPFSSLRYPKADPQTWGILVWRNYPRDFRYAFHSSPIPRGANCHICHMRSMPGLTGLPEGGHLVVAPYATATQTSEPRDASDIRSEFVHHPAEGDAGVDVKWNPSANTAVDATINPDFSQIESDVAQIGVNQRFALFFPEKRPFFLEGVDLFDTPIQAVHTRTITSPRWGGRGTGKIGGAAWTLLVTEDRGGGSVIIPGPDFSQFAPQDFRSIAAIGRLRHDFGTSFGGLLVTDREIRGGGHNRVFGPDFEWRPNAADRVSAQFLWSDTQTPDRPGLADEWDGRELSGGALHFRWSHTTRGPEWFLQYRDFGNGFRADDGFVPQVGFREGEGFAAWNFFPEGLLRRVRPQLFSEYTYDREGGLISRFVVPGIFVQGTRNLVGVLEANFAGVRIGDRVFERENAFFLFQIDPSRRLSRIAIDGNVGEEFDFANARVGDGLRLRAAVTIKPTDHLAVELLGTRQTVDVRADDGREGRLFTADVGRIKATYNFTARALLRLIGQWVETERDPTLYRFAVARRSGSFDGSALFAYKLNWQTVLFVGYGDNRALLATGDLEPAGRQFLLKVSYAFQT